MPSRDTKVITMRVSNDDYFKWLELAAKNKQQISTFMKQCINTHIGYSASNGGKLESRLAGDPGLFYEGYRLIIKGNKSEIIFLFGDDGIGQFYERNWNNNKFIILPKANPKNISSEVDRYSYEDIQGKLYFYIHSRLRVGRTPLDFEKISIPKSKIYDENIKDGIVIDFRIKQ